MPTFSGKGPRILTIDNGGLQAISVLIVLRDVCDALSKASGSSRSLAPHELFDIIAGVGTGGWLAILLGRYKLTIEQCMGIYTTIASALDPGRKTSSSNRTKGSPAAIDQGMLIEQVGTMLAEYEMSDKMLGEDCSPDSNVDSPSCHAFAVAVVKCAKGDSDVPYHLFRAYQPAQNSKHSGPDPWKCKVTDACASTAAAKDFCREYTMTNTTYWDDSFPNTHNVSSLALDEAAAIFGSDLAPDFVLSVSPGIPTDKQIHTLKRIASRNASTASKIRTHLSSLRRAFSAPRLENTVPNSPIVLTRSYTDPAVHNSGFNVSRTGTDTSTRSIEKERKHQTALKERLKNDFNDEGIYHRLELHQEGPDSKPYLNDVANADRAIKSAKTFLHLHQTQTTIKQLEARSSINSNSALSNDNEVPRCPSPETLPSDAQPPIFSNEHQESITWHHEVTTT